MKKTILVSLAGLALFLAGCTQQNPAANQNLNTNESIIQFTDWQTYQSKKNNYEIKYPNNLKLEETQSDDKMYANLWTIDEYNRYKSGATTASPYLWIEVASLNGVSLENWIKNKGGSWTLENTPYNFGGIKYLKVHEEGEGSGAYLFITASSTKVLIIGSINDNSNDEIFKKILSSLIYLQ